MRIAIDIDGVIADQIPGVLKRIKDKYGVQMTKGQIRRWDEPVPDTTTDIRVEIETALSKDPNYILEMPVIHGAVDAITQLDQEGHTIILATHRDPAVEMHTRKWLVAMGIRFHGVLNTIGVGKGSIVADVLVDDNPDNVMAFSAGGRTGLLFTQPWNDNFEQGRHERILRVHGWGEVMKVIRQLKLGRGEQ